MMRGDETETGSEEAGGMDSSERTGVTTVEINYGFVKTRAGLIMAVQVFFQFDLCC